LPIGVNVKVADLLSLKLIGCADRLFCEPVKVVGVLAP
jgi:hypothetical protein